MTVADALPVPILIVDDNTAKRLATKAVLSPLGYRLVEADSGLAALRCVMAEDFAVILLDVRMPVMDGFETAALIRQRPKSEMTPIIFITAFRSDEMMKADRYAEGAVDFIFLPVPPAELRAKVSVFANLFTRAQELAAKAGELQATVNQLARMMDAAPTGIFQTDAANRYVYTNPRWSEITGLPADEAIGRNWDSIIEPGQRPGALAAWTAHGMGPREFVHRFDLRADGMPSRTVVSTSKCIRDADDGIAGWVGTLADVTADTWPTQSDETSSPSGKTVYGG
jgi:PAS domain S-box-containing protein